jgi:hypothetical protein
MQHASVAARYQLGEMTVGALVGYGATGSIDGALMGASFGQMGGSIAAHFAEACFTAGTPLVVDMEGNSRPIDEIEVGDFVLAHSEFDPNGPLELKRVEEKFVRTSVVMELVVRVRSIKTTAEHPFFVPAQGKFVAAGEVQVGEQLVGHDGKLVEIESIGSTGEVTTVYNLRVADFHTYFVGGGLWGFDVWVHNAQYKFMSSNVSGSLGNNLSGSAFGGNMLRTMGFEAAHVVPWDLTRAAPLRKLLMRNGFTESDIKYGPANGVWLPGSKLKSDWLPGTWHQGGSTQTPSTSKHSKAAMQEIMRRLRPFDGDADGLRQELKTIGTDWQDGKWTL